MKGIVFNLLEEVVRREYGEDTWDTLLEAAGLDGVYTSLGNYPHEELLQLVTAASPALQMPAEAIIRWFGRHAIALLVERYPEFFEAHKTTRAFLLTLNDVIHPEVRKIYPGADVPIFDYDTSSEEVLEMKYRSARKLCMFGQGLIEGAAAHYGEAVSIEQLKCMNRGDDRCEFRVAFTLEEA
jgi:Haem-NO-binding